MDRESEAHSAGLRGEAYSANTYGEMLAHERGEALRSGRGGGFPIILAPVVGVLLACLWPLVGALTLLGAAIGLWLLGLSFPRHDGMAALITFLVAGGVALYYALKVERVFQRSRAYRVFRHVLRLVLLGALFLWLALQSGHSVLNPLYVPDEITLRWIDSQLTPGKYVTIFVVLVLAHVVSKRLDERVVVWLSARRIAGVAPNVTDGKVEGIAGALMRERAEERSARWRRRRKYGAIFGTIAAILLAVFGEPFGSVVFGFLVFGLIGALLSRFLVRKPKATPRTPEPGPPPGEGWAQGR